MEKLSHAIIAFMIKNKIIVEQDKEIYLFGLELMFRILLNILTVLFIGVLFDMVVESIVFVICTLMVRSYSGGFHADNPVICYILSIAFIVVALLSIRLQLWNMRLVIISIVLSGIIFIRYAPISHKNKPLEKIEIFVYRKKLFINICTLLFISILLVPIHLDNIIFSIASALFISAIMVFFVQWHDNCIYKHYRF